MHFLGAALLVWSPATQSATDNPALAFKPSTPQDAQQLSRLEPLTPEVPSAPARKLARSNRNGGDVNGRSSASVDVLYVDMTINGQRQKSLVRVEQQADGNLLLPVDAWGQARLLSASKRYLLSDGSTAFALNDVPRASWSLDRKNQRLDIDMPADAFVASTFGDAVTVHSPPPRPDPGVILNYDAALTHSHKQGRPSSGISLEAIVFNGFGSFVTSAVARHDGRDGEAYRLESFWRYDLPHRMETLVVGDTVGASGGWSRPARYAGVRWGRDFSTRPGFVTTPQLTLAGQATLPSTVDVLVDNARRLSQPVQPGPFDLTNVPLTSGAGEVNLVVRDLLGRQTVVTQSYYYTPSLLAPGLSDFSFEAGWLRRGYGRNVSYDKDLFGSMTWRQGMTPRLTGEVRLEVQPHRRAAGVDLNGLLGLWASGRIAMAMSSTKGLGGQTEAGHVLQLGLQRSSRSGGFSMQYERTSRGFSSFGELPVDTSIGVSLPGHRPRQTLFLGMGGSLGDRVYGGLNYVQRERWDADTVKALGGSLSWWSGRWARFQFSLNKRLDGERDWQAALSVHIPLANGVSASSRVERNASGDIGVALAARSNPPTGPGLGWNVEASHPEGLRARAGLQYNTNTSELTADASTWQDGDTALRLGARGSVGFLAGMPFASRPIGQSSFAVVSVDGIADVPIKRSHQVVAYTNQDGRAFIPGLLPWQVNQLAIDPVDLPLDAEVEDFSKNVTPYPRSGALVTFDVRRSRQALLTLIQSDGEPVPVGTRVRLLPDGPEFTAGRRGKVWLTNLDQASQLLEVHWNGNAGCRLTVELPDIGEQSPASLGPLVCGGQRP